MHVGSLQLLVRWLPNMHVRHHQAVRRPCIVFSKLLGLLKGNHRAVVAGHLHYAAQAFILKQMHHEKGLRAGGVYLVL